VEGVAMREDWRGRGPDHAVMDAIEQVIRGGYQLGALCASATGTTLYRSRGWLCWSATGETVTSGSDRTPPVDR